MQAAMPSHWLKSSLITASLILLAGCSPSASESSTGSSAWKENLNSPASEEELAHDDGPYAFYTEDNSILELYWVCRDTIVHRTQPLAETIPVECGFHKPIQAAEPPSPLPEVRFEARKIAALSDIHGQFEVLLELLRNNDIINETWDWNFADGHLVIAGDVFDRGPQQTEALWLLYQLDQQAVAHGGRVHMLLGNHETMVLYDDLRYLNSKYEHVASTLNRRFPELYGKDTVLGAWLHTRPVIVTVNDTVFMHGGLHPDYQELGMSVEDVNEHYRESLGIPRATLMETPVLQFLYGRLGPLWYRGYFRDQDQLTSEQLDGLLESLSANQIVVGHTSFSGVYQHWNGRVINVDSNIKRGLSGEILFWENGEFTVGSLAGERHAVPKWEG